MFSVLMNSIGRALSPDRFVVMFFFAIASASALGDDALWAHLRQGGLIVLMRHAMTPVLFGDPPGMRLDDCATQRNLTESGREQAKRIGAAFTQQQVKVYEVRSSRLCRCLDTARLAFGQAIAFDEISSITQDTLERREEKSTWLRRFLSAPTAMPDSNLVLVTHNFNIQDATGITIAMGESLVIRPKGEAGFEVIGNLPPP